jgi:hypothetical protein
MKPKGTAPYLLLLAVLLSLSLVGCSRVSRQADPAPDVDIALAINPDPPGVGPTQLTVSVTGADGTPIDGARLSIKGDMTHAGMQPVLASTDGGVGGQYQTRFEWTMGGDWIVTVTAHLPDGRTTARQFSYTVEEDLCGLPEDTKLSETAGRQ